MLKFTSEQLAEIFDRLSEMARQDAKTTEFVREQNYHEGRANAYRKAAEMAREHQREMADVAG